MFKSCCALYNFLLEADGMDVPWEGSYSCDYESLEFDDFNDADTPNSIHELYREHGDLRSIDLSSIGVNNIFNYDNFQTENNEDESMDDSEDQEMPIFTDANSARHVKLLPHDYFRSKLVEHFDILFERKEIVWPKLVKKQQSL